MQIVDNTAKTQGFQAMVPMRDGARLNTFVFLPGTGGPSWPVILHRTPYGIAAADAADQTDVARAWLPNPEEPLRGAREQASSCRSIKKSIARVAENRVRHDDEA